MERDSVYEEYIRKRENKMKKKRRNKIRRRIFFTCIFILLGTLVYFLYNSDFFKIDEINCSGNNVVATEEIVKISGINLGDNLFMSSVKRAQKNIGEIPYIDTYKVWRTLPNKINIRVTEAMPIAYIGKENAFWIVDKNGKLLEMSESYDAEKHIPLITGISVDNYNVGDVLHSSRNELLSQGIKCAEILERFDLLSKTNEINIENREDIKISYDNRLYMYMGSFDTFEYKIGNVKQILDNRYITEYEHAVLNYRTDKLYVGNEDMFVASEELTETDKPTESEEPNETQNPENSSSPTKTELTE